MKSSFLVMALRCIAKTLYDLKEEGVTEGTYLLLDDVIAFSELTERYRWLVLTKLNISKIPATESISKLNEELEESMKSYPELANYNFTQGDPFMFLIEKRGLAPGELMSTHEEHTKCVDVAAVREIVLTVMDYNFYYKHKKVLRDRFKISEKQMESLSKRDKWPGRGSWNAFVSKTKKQKKNTDFSFLEKFDLPTAYPTESISAPNDSPSVSKDNAQNLKRNIDDQANVQS